MSEQTPEEIASQIVLGYQSSYDACKDDILRDDIAGAIKVAYEDAASIARKTAETSLQYGDHIDAANTLIALAETLEGIARAEAK